MRRLCLVLLAVLVGASSARAQTAADSALVREIVERMHLDRQFAFAETMTEMLLQQAGLPLEPLRFSRHDTRKMEASVRRALLADPRTDLLRAVRDHYASGVVDRTSAIARQLIEPDRLQAVLAAGATGDASVLGDRALALRLYRANRSSDTERRTQIALVDHLAKSPALHARLTVAGLSPDAFLASLQSAAEAPGDEPDEAALTGARYMIRQMDPADVDAAIAFGESDAARYLNEATSAPVVDALVQRMGTWMEAFFLAMLDAAEAQRAGITAEDVDDVPPPVPPPPAAVAFSADPSPVRDPLSDLPPPDALIPTGVFDVVEREPELIGGLDGLAARLVYPESARRANIEGTVYVTFVVDYDGRPRHISSVGAPDDALRSSAMDVVQASRFIPGQQDGRAVRVRYTLPVRFSLR